MNDNGFTLDGFVELRTRQRTSASTPVLSLYQNGRTINAFLNKASQMALGQPTHVQPMHDPASGTIILVPSDHGYVLTKGQMGGKAISLVLAPQLESGQRVRFAVDIREIDGQAVAVIGERLP